MKPKVVLIEKHDKRIEKLTEKQKEIFNALDELQEAKASDIMKGLPGSIPERTLRHALGILKKQGLVDSKGATKNTIWFIKK